MQKEKGQLVASSVGDAWLLKAKGKQLFLVL